MSEHEEAQGTGHREDNPSGWKANALLLFVVGFVVSLIIGWVVFPQLLYSQKMQPFDFNHAAHTEEQGMDCDECHRYGDNGRFSGVPTFQECLVCHSWGDRQNEDNKAETEFLEKFVDPDTDELIGDPQWLIYSGQPDCVYFSHIAHTEKGGLSCEECHGDHGKSTSLRPYYENRITRYSKDIDAVWRGDRGFKMTDCGDCHEEHWDGEGKIAPNNACFVCHK